MDGTTRVNNPVHNAVAIAQVEARESITSLSPLLSILAQEIANGSNPVEISGIVAEINKAVVNLNVSYGAYAVSMGMLENGGLENPSGP